LEHLALIHHHGRKAAEASYRASKQEKLEPVDNIGIRS
jgi:hypothetical protein